MPPGTRPKLIFRVHAIRRMFQRHIDSDQVHQVVLAGEVIETYSTDTPYPSRLVLGWSRGRPLHVVVADNVADHEIIVVTAYEPDPAQWDADFRRRKP